MGPISSRLSVKVFCFSWGNALTMRTTCSMDNQNVQKNEILMKFTDAHCALLRHRRRRRRGCLMHNAKVQLETTKNS